MQIKHFLIGSANVGVLSFLNGFGTVQAGSVGEVVIKSIFSMLGGVVVSLALPVLKKKFPEYFGRLKERKKIKNGSN